MEKENKKTSKTANKTDSSKVYELGYLLVASLPDEKITDEVAALKALIEKNGSDIISSEDPILIDLAYPMVKVVSAERHKYNRGYFGWIKFDTEAEGVLSIKKALDLSPTMLRYLIVKTVRENTLLNGKMVLRREEREEVVVDGEEVVDDGSVEGGDVLENEKAIDDLVIA